MPKLTKTISLALAATGLTLAMPASAAVPMQAAPQVQMHAGAHADIAADTTFEHGKKHRKYKKRKHRRHHHDRYYGERVVVVRERAPRPYYMGYDRNWGQPVRRDTRIWRGRDSRYYCRKDDGTTGLLVGAGVGALIGHEVAGRGGDRTLGAIIGGAAGALLGRSIDRSSTRCG
ncbi:glycine zipper 2TM domain-containing protein [Erythrobacter sp. SD-21]|uniref:glycine zipper 2TM domain-containing protein n=1 Tax=Erythrobacter sp. SD-21 TaxID=161528 RepID=UPI000153F4BB|nr:glycine zipper 2TM domain-containing protein [Erythrobacter sp. SD-21]EDL49025.1 17 kDa surface antigen [Erythrobacter sp. SD-21]